MGHPEQSVILDHQVDVDTKDPGDHPDKTDTEEPRDHQDPWEPQDLPQFSQPCCHQQDTETPKDQSIITDTATTTTTTISIITLRKKRKKSDHKWICLI